MSILAFFSFWIITSIFTFYHETHVALQQHIAVNQNISTKDETYEAYAQAIVKKVPVGKPVVFVVPLNGTPDGVDHPSYKNALVGLEVLLRIPDRKKYVILSEGHTDNACISGAEVISNLLFLPEGYNDYLDITVLLEKEATTTVKNISFSKQVIQNTFPNEEVYIVMVGISDVRSGLGIDIGHVARAYILAKQSWSKDKNIHFVGILPVNNIDTTIEKYSPRYDFATMVLATTGLLYLSEFDRPPITAGIEQCP